MLGVNVVPSTPLSANCMDWVHNSKYSGTLTYKRLILRVFWLMSRCSVSFFALSCELKSNLWASFRYAADSGDICPSSSISVIHFTWVPQCGSTSVLLCSCYVFFVQLFCQTMGPLSFHLFQTRSKAFLHIPSGQRPHFAVQQEIILVMPNITMIFKFRFPFKKTNKLK